MNLRGFLTGMFRDYVADGELEEARDAGKRDAQLVTGAYVQAFDAEATRIFTERQQRMIGLEKEDDDGIVDGEFTPVKTHKPRTATKRKPVKKTRAKSRR